MNDTEPDWLKPIIKLEDFNGNIELYLEHLFSVFKNDFIDNRPSFQGRAVLYDKKDDNGRPQGFVHITTEENHHSGEREICLRRCERISWVRAIIENSNDPLVLVWVKEMHSPRGKWVKRTSLFLESQNFLVILEEMKHGFFMITSIYVDNEKQKIKHLKEHQRLTKKDN